MTSTRKGRRSHTEKKRGKDGSEPQWLHVKCSGGREWKRKNEGPQSDTKSRTRISMP